MYRLHFQYTKDRLLLCCNPDAITKETADKLESNASQTNDQHLLRQNTAVKAISSARTGEIKGKKEQVDSTAKFAHDRFVFHLERRDRMAERCGTACGRNQSSQIGTDSNNKNRCKELLGGITSR